MFTFRHSQVTLLVLHDLPPTVSAGHRWRCSRVGLGGLHLAHQRVRHDNVWHEATVIAAMAAMLVAAAALPTAFASGALVFAIGLLVVRLIHVVKFVPFLRTRTPSCGGAPVE
ncbi:low temperature requirement protein A [Mycobacterium paraense]|uniref:low temperature requirement protein A n=1 Tax=Mycobacterium paraense TaxID=767916 RepID=UPI00155548C0|nr:low temperature requirement protein A [Mycobacterium paraense]